MPKFTRRELVYLRMAIRGDTNAEIARRMGVAGDAVVANVFTRMKKRLGYQTLRQMYFALGKEVAAAK